MIKNVLPRIVMKHSVCVLADNLVMIVYCRTDMYSAVDYSGLDFCSFLQHRWFETSHGKCTLLTSDWYADDASVLIFSFCWFCLRGLKVTVGYWNWWQKHLKSVWSDTKCIVRQHQGHCCGACDTGSPLSFSDVSWPPASLTHHHTFRHKLMSPPKQCQHCLNNLNISPWAVNFQAGRHTIQRNLALFFPVYFVFHYLSFYCC